MNIIGKQKILTESLKFAISEACKGTLTDNYFSKLSTEEKEKFSEIIKTQRLSSILLSNKDLQFLVNVPHIDDIKKLAVMQNISTAKILKEAEQLANSLNNKKIEYCFLKGIAMILHFNLNHERRPLRDIDILINVYDFKKVRKILENLGYQKDQTKQYRKNNYVKMNFLNQSGTCIEVHTRVTHEKHYNECPLSIQILKKKIAIERNNVLFKIPSKPELYSHILYHGTKKEYFNVGPIFMLDNYYLTDDNLNKDYINNLGLKKTLAFVKIAVDKYFHGKDTINMQKNEHNDILFYNPLERENLIFFFSDYFYHSFVDFFLSLKEGKNIHLIIPRIIKGLKRSIFFFLDNIFNNEKRVFLKK